MATPSWADHDLVTLRKRVFSIAPKVEVSTPDGRPVLF